jgi:membrane-associated protease RseP (regulator of RpoE activity)
MIYLAILLHILGDYAPKWILKEKYIVLQDSFSWKYSLTKLSGLIITFVLAFCLIVAFTFSTKERYVANQDAIYGLEFSPMMKELGFENGDKIVSVNGQQVDRPDNIEIMILQEPADAEVEITRGGETQKVVITERGVHTIMKSGSMKDVKVKMQPDTITGNDFRNVKITEVNHGIADVFNAFSDIWKQVVILYSPSVSEYSGIGGFITISKISTFRGYMIVLAICSIFIGMVNFIPLPGLDAGNFLISVVEKYRRKRFNKRIISTLKGISISLVILFILIKVF